MSNYVMNITGIIGLSDYSNIYDYIDIVSNNDKVTISFDKSNQDNINIVCSMLNDKNFAISSQGYDETGTYYINACRNL